MKRGPAAGAWAAAAALAATLGITVAGLSPWPRTSLVDLAPAALRPLARFTDGAALSPRATTEPWPPGGSRPITNAAAERPQGSVGAQKPRTGRRPRVGPLGWLSRLSRHPDSG
jgi:hypothetical protein